MNITKKMKLCVAVAASFTLGYVSTASAQFITWETSVPLFNSESLESFVDTTGDTAVAMNVVTNGQANAADPSNVTVTVNGVLFTPSGSGSLLVGPGGESIECNSGTSVDPVTGNPILIGANGGAFREGDFDAATHPNITNLVRGAAFRISSITLGGLTIGQEYRLQAFVQDGRNTRDTNWLTGFGDGSGSTAPVGTAKLSNQVPGTDPPVEVNGDSIIGTFTAASETLTFNLFGTQDGGTTWTGDGVSGRAQMNAIQLRRVGGSPPVGLGDFDLDGDVDLADLDQYNQNIGAAATGALEALDLNGDGVVGADDFEQHYSTLVVTSNGQKGTFAGDVNLSGTVDVLGDAFALVGNLNNAATSWAQGDLNADGAVNVLGDAFALVGNLGNTNEPTE